MLDVSVNPATARARLVWDPAKVRLGDLLRVLEHVGLRPHPLAGEPAEQLAILERRTALKRLAVAGFGMMQVMMFARAALHRRSRRAWTPASANCCGS